MEVVTANKQKLPGILRAVKSTHPDVIYFDWVHSFILGKTLLATCVKSIVFLFDIVYLFYLKRIPFIHTAHNLQNHKQKFPAIEKLLYRFFLRRCHKIRTYSEAVKAELVSQFGISPRKIYVIQDIPYHHYYPNDTSPAKSRLQLGRAEKDFIYLFFGRIEPYKGLENLILSFISVTTTDCFLMIAGESLDPAYLLYLKNIASACPNILWFDQFIEADQVQYFFNAADVAVLPFVRIDHSGSVDLSMSFAKPVITLKTAATAALLAQQSALLFEKPSELSGCLLHARQSDLKQIGMQNYTLADSTNYSELPGLFKK